MSTLDLTKLPKKVAAEIERLERDVEHWRNQAHVGPDGSDTFLHMYEEDGALGGRPLGTGAHVRFDLDDRETHIMVHNLGDGTVEVYLGGHGAGPRLSVVPQSSNQILLAPANR